MKWKCKSHWSLPKWYKYIHAVKSKISEGLYSAVLHPINIETLNHSSYITVPFQGVWQERLRELGHRAAFLLFPCGVSLCSQYQQQQTGELSIESSPVRDSTTALKTCVSDFRPQLFLPWTWLDVSRGGQMFSEIQVGQEVQSQEEKFIIIA